MSWISCPVNISVEAADALLQAGSWTSIADWTQALCTMPSASEPVTVQAAIASFVADFSLAYAAPRRVLKAWYPLARALSDGSWPAYMLAVSQRFSHRHVCFDDVEFRGLLSAYRRL